jgi:hypothetical protein
MLCLLVAALVLRAHLAVVQVEFLGVGLFLNPLALLVQEEGLALMVDIHAMATSLLAAVALVAQVFLVAQVVMVVLVLLIIGEYLVVPVVALQHQLQMAIMVV